MTHDEQLLTDIVGAVAASFGALARSVEQHTEGNFNPRGVATSINDIANALPPSTVNRATIVAVFKAIAAGLNQEAAAAARTSIPLPPRPGA